MTDRQGPYVLLAAVVVAVPAVCGLLCLRPAQTLAVIVLVGVVSLVW
jgi:hypothetical protein